MACHAAMIENPPTIKADQTVDQALALMAKKGLDFMAVVDAQGRLEGVLSYRILFKNLLPVSVSLPGGARADVTVRAAPGIAKRLRTVGQVPVSDIMERKVPVVYPETPTWEAINYLVEYEVPLMVVEPASGKVMGMITGASAFAEIQRMRNE